MEIFGFTISNWLLILCLLLAAFYIYSTWTFGQLSALGVVGPKPWPLVGNLPYMVKEGFYEYDLPLRKKYGKIYGYYEGRVPHISVGDVDILKYILVKDFHNFTNRRVFHMRGILKEALFDSRDKAWKDSRSLLSPTFSSGKLKMLIPAIQDCARTLIRNMAKRAETKEPFEAKIVSSWFTMDVIALTEFGMKLDTQNQPDNELMLRSQEIFKMSLTDFWIFCVFLLPDLCPLLEPFHPSMIPQSCESYFRALIPALLEERRTAKTDFQDLIKLMLDAEESHDEGHAGTKRKCLTSQQILCNACLFILAGYETTATTISYLLYHLTLDQDAQENAREEARTVLDGQDKVRTDTVNQLHYLEMCINETLRLHPPLTRVDRQAQDTVHYEGLTIPKGMTVDIPIRAIHMDPEYWPEPETFDPERFTQEAKDARNPYCFLPFGLGPRQCIGLRLAMLEIKIAMAMLLTNFRFVTCDRTENPLQMNRSSLFPIAQNGIWIRAEKLE